VTRSARTVFVDGKPPESLGRYATTTPVVVFHPGDIALLSGPASARRTVLDRIALFIDPSSADHRARYRRATRARAVALIERGTRAPDLGPLEELMAVHGAALGRNRALATDELARALVPIFTSMAAPGLNLTLGFSPGGSLDVGELQQELFRRREADLRRKTAGYGPHRDDMTLSLEGRTVRRHASQGQARVLTLALKVAELECIRQARQAEPILLLDDVSSELDPQRTGAVYAYLHTTPSQIWVTTTRPELFTTADANPDSRADFRLCAGRLSRV
jgi:DNA replication and repair protein RecF